MGFFSWKTSDTQEPIRNIHAEMPHDDTHGAVYLLQPDGDHIKEAAYDGYGEFGGVDAYAWLANINLGITGSNDYLRNVGINLFFDKDAVIKYPLKFSFNPDADYDSLPAAQDDPDQGYFFDL